MKSKDDLLQRWQELARFWDDEASHSFEHQHLNIILECMEEIEREYEKFVHCTDDYQ